MATQPDMTAHWESQLDGISRKQASYQQFMQNLTQLLPELLHYINFSALRELSRHNPGVNKIAPRAKKS